MAEKREGLARKRLLDAAEALFAANGFEATSIRDLTARAGCNLAAVNYHFGGKDQLYRTLFERYMDVLRDTRVAAIEGVMSKPAEVTLEELLYAFARSFVEPLLDEKNGNSLLMLMSREMLHPRLPRNLFVEKVVVPTFAVLGEALLKVCPALDERKAQLVIRSIIGQLLHTIQAERMVGPENEINTFITDIDKIIEHIVKFSAAGIRAYEKGDIK